MKFIFATIAIFLLFSFGFGQTTATTADDKINAEIKQLFKDAETDFASIQGNVQNRGGGIITYQPTKNYFQTAGFTSWFRYYEADKTIGLQFSGSGESAKEVFELVESKFNPFFSNAEVRSSGNSGEVFVNNQRIALLQENSDKYVMWFYSNRSAWHDFNKSDDYKRINDFFDFFEIPFRVGIKDGSSNYEALLKKCNEFYGKNDYPKAIKACTEAIKANDKGIEAYIARGNAYLNTPDEKERDSKELTKQNSIGINEELAEKDFIKVTELDPKSSDNFVRLAEVQMKIYTALEYDDAIANLEKARQLNPNNAIVYYDLGEAWREFVDGDFTKVREYRNRAIANYTKYISLKPSDDKGYLGRGLTYFKEDKYEEAIADLSKYIQSGKMNDQAFSARGQSYLELEKYPQAIDDLTKAIKIHVFSPKYKGDTDDLKTAVYSSRAEAYKALGKNKEACQDLKVIGEDCD